MIQADSAFHILTALGGVGETGTDTLTYHVYSKHDVKTNFYLSAHNPYLSIPYLSKSLLNATVVSTSITTFDNVFQAPTTVF